METPNYIKELFSKCEKLIDVSYLRATFGANHVYRITKSDNGFVLSQHGVYWRENKTISSFFFKTERELYTTLKTEPYHRFYSVNHFSGKPIHMDNIGNFCNAFKEVDIVIKEDSSDLIPVHINRARDEDYFWEWSSDIKKWVRANEIPENLKRAYKNPS